jgi:hypothetical protein
MRVCESVSLRHNLVTKQVWSPDSLVCGELIWSRVRANRASSLGLIQNLYGQETPKSLQGEQPETDKASGVICFSLYAREEDPLPLHSPYPFCLHLCVDVWQSGGIGGDQSKSTLPLQL